MKRKKKVHKNQIKKATYEGRKFRDEVEKRGGADAFVDSLRVKEEKARDAVIDGMVAKAVDRLKTETTPTISFAGIISQDRWDRIFRRV